MRSFVNIVVILWFCMRIVTAFRITNELNIDNLTETFDGTSLLMGSNNNGSQDNQTIDEMVDGFDGIDGNSNSTNDTLDFDGSTSGMMAAAIDEKINSSINLNHNVHHSAALIASSSRDPVRGIIFRQKVKPEARSFFGLIIIPCKCKVFAKIVHLYNAFHTLM